VNASSAWGPVGRCRSRGRRSRQHLADLGLGPDRAEHPGAGADDGDRLALEGVGGERARGPVEGVLELAGEGGVVLGRRDQDGVGGRDRIAQLGGALGRSGDVVVLVVGRNGLQAIEDLADGRRQQSAAARTSAVLWEPRRRLPEIASTFIISP
jgi:hypothetical protein